MRIIRFLNELGVPNLAAVTDGGGIYVLPYQDLLEIACLAEEKETTILKLVQKIIDDRLPLEASLEDLKLLVPIEAPEVWASGVTYLKSREARNFEATGGKLDAATFYDKVYEADRPEIFLKSTSARTIGTNAEVFLRSDSTWQIPEPELGLVINKTGKILGYTIGNDMSCRDIEGENPLYLPQAKIWKNSCSIGPAILIHEDGIDPYNFEITCKIYRDDEQIFEGSANTNMLKRKLEELVSYLVRDNEIFDGTVLLTGTCIVPPNEFTLADGDRVDIEISDIGVLSNPVKCQKKI